MEILMMKTRILSALALTALVGVAACERQEETQIQTPATEAPATAPAPATMPATDMHADTLHGGMHMDTLPADTL
jgi:hypothetical protein